MVSTIGYALEQALVKPVITLTKCDGSPDKISTIQVILIIQTTHSDVH
jgi:hypothetical protein